MINDELPEFRVYPNPTDGKFALEFKSLKEEFMNIFITDQTGRVVMKADISSKPGMMQHLLNIENIQPGIYNLMLKAGDRNFRMERITLIR